MTASLAAARASRSGRRPERTAGLRAGRPVRGSRLAFWGFVSPFFIGLAVFGVIAIGWSIVLSFFQARATLTPGRFVGLDNYLALLGDKSFVNSMLVFLVFAVVIVPVTLAFSLGLALLVHNLPVGRAFFRSVFFLPTAFSYVIASLIWKLAIFNGQGSGAANGVLDLFGTDPISQWLTQSPLYWAPIISVRLWLQVGFYMLLLIAGLQRISEVLYEAAAIDGLSSGPRRFFLITLPQLRPTVAAVVLLLTIAAFQAFDEFFNLVNKLPSARPPLLYLYNISFATLDYGKGAAGALLLTIVMMGVALLQTRFLGFGTSDDPAGR